MSFSPPLRRLSEASTSSRESLINAYEAEEERIINILSRKLEKLREEKIELENVLEAESESHVNRLSREISALRIAQQQAVNGSGTLSPVETRSAATGANRLDPTTETMLDAMRRENEQLRARLGATERDYIRITRLNEIYREELIDHRRRLGLSVDSLIGLAPSSADPLSQPLHRRPSVSSSPQTSIPHSPIMTQSARVPIPRPPSQIHRPVHAADFASPSITPPSVSSASASVPSPTLFSPPVGPVSNGTSATTPGSLGSLTDGPATLPRALELTYPSVPPPSLSSSFGEPPSIGSPVRSPTFPALDTIAEPIAISTNGQTNGHTHDPSWSPTFGPRTRVPRRSSFERAGRTGEHSVSISPVRTRSRMESLERGARVAETGTLVPRQRRGSNMNSNDGGGGGPPDQKTII